VPQLSTRPGVQGGAFALPRKGGRHFCRLGVGTRLPNPPLCCCGLLKPVNGRCGAVAWSKTSKRVAWSGGLVIWGSPSTGVGKAGLPSPKLGRVAAPTSPTELETPWHSLGTPTSPGTAERGGHSPKCSPHPRVRSGLGCCSRRGCGAWGAHRQCQGMLASPRTVFPPAPCQLRCFL